MFKSLITFSLLLASALVVTAEEDFDTKIRRLICEAADGIWQPNTIAHESGRNYHGICTNTWGQNLAVLRKKKPAISASWDGELDYHDKRREAHPGLVEAVVAAPVAGLRRAIRGPKKKSTTKTNNWRSGRRWSS